MGKRTERRAALTSELYPDHSLKLGGSSLKTWGALAMLAGAGGVGDVVVANMWFGPVYLLAICAAAWMLGAGQAVGLGTACLGFTYCVNGLQIRPFGAASLPADIILRVAFVLIAIGLVNAARRLYLREWRLARTDLLTGAMNRQAFFEAVSRAGPSPFWTLIAYADLDGLKQINDVCGHQEGDEALRGFAGAVRRNIRQTDLFARLGGDEFVVLMEVRDEAAAKATAARLHRAMNAGFTGASVSAGCSLGAAILPPGFSRGTDRLRLADRLMYEAKQRGSGLVTATMTDSQNPAALLRHAEPAVPAQAMEAAPIPSGRKAVA
jgi:diguanylate cyclase (GGDEF)-like protein